MMFSIMFGRKMQKKKISQMRKSIKMGFPSVGKGHMVNKKEHLELN